MSFDAKLASLIDFTHFAPTVTRAEISKLCAEALEKKFHAVCVNSSRVELAYSILEETDIQVVGLVGFPLGAEDTDVKRYDVETAVDYGAQEIDFVINLGRLKDGDHKFVLREMRDIVEAADELPVKAIIEAHLLTNDEKILMCKLALDSGVHFISTATDFHTPPVIVEDIKLLRENLGDQFGIKAVGQIRDAQTAQKLIDAGATRLGIVAGNFNP